MIIIICWRLIWPLVKSGAIAANPFAHIPLPAPHPAPAQAWNSLARHKFLVWLDCNCTTKLVFGLVRVSSWAPCMDVEPIYYCCKALLPPTHPPYPPTVYQNLNPEFLISAGFLSGWKFLNLLQRLMWLAHKKQVVKKPAQQNLQWREFLYINLVIWVPIVKINFVHTHRFIRVPLYSFASCAAPKLHDQPNKRDIYICQCVWVHVYFSWDETSSFVSVWVHLKNWI